MEVLLNMIGCSEHVPTKTIRNMLKDDLPASIPKSAEFIVNLRIQAQKYLKNIDGDGITNSSKFVINEEDSCRLIDDSTAHAKKGSIGEFDLNNPEYIGVDTEKLRELLRKALTLGKELDQIISLLYQTNE